MMLSHMSVSHILTVSKDDLEPFGYMFTILGAVLLGIIGTLLYGTWVHLSLRKEYHIYAVKKKKESDVIVVPESPPPTRSVKLTSSESHRRMAQSFRARRRGGRARHGDHKRVCTRVYNPATKNDCGYSCLLKACGLEPNAKHVQDLRDVTAEAVRQAYIDDVYVCDMSVRDMVQESHLTLAAYVAKVKWNLWASPVELLLAARHLNLQVAISVNGSVTKFGDKPRHIVKLSHQHYMLYKVRRSPTSSSKVPLSRGGMRPGPWTWDDRNPTLVSISSRPAPPVSPREDIPEWAITNTPLQTVVPAQPEIPEPYVAKVDISPSVITDLVTVMLVVREGMTIMHLRCRIASMLGVPADRLMMTDMDNTEIPLHLAIPKTLRAHDKWAADSNSYDVLEVYTTPGTQDSAFVIRVNQLWTHAYLMDKLASIVNVDVNNITLTDLQGNHWHYPESRLSTMALLMHVRREQPPSMAQERGGARTVSTTQPCQHAENQRTQNLQVADERTPIEGLETENPDIVAEGIRIENLEGLEGERVHVEQKVGDFDRVNEECAVPDDDEIPDNGDHDLCEQDPQHGHVQRQRSRSPRNSMSSIQRPVGMVDGGVLYCPEERALTERALRRHQKLMARVQGTDRHPVRSPSCPASSVASDALLTSMAWPTTPPPAQPDMIPRPIEDDLGAVGAVQAYPLARAADVVETVIEKVKPTDLVQVIPHSAYHWREVEKIIIPPQTKVDVHQGVDLRLSRWELYQEVRHVPIMAYGRVIRTIVLPWHITMDNAMSRIEDRAPAHKQWLMSSVSPQNWVLHQLMLPESVREELCELDRLKEERWARGGMRPGKVLLRAYVVHIEEFQQWKVDTDMDIGYLLQAHAHEYETDLSNVLIMRGKHIPGVHEVITSYLPEIQVYIVNCIDEELVMSQHTLRAGVMWQQAKTGKFPWGIPLLPRPKGKPIVYGPAVGKVAVNMYQCWLRPAHDLDQLYCVDFCEKATIASILEMLEKPTEQPASSMMIIKDGRILPTHVLATRALPVAYLVMGHRLDSVDACVPDDLMSEVSWSLSLSSHATSPRGGARTNRIAQQPRAVMLVWAEDKITREVPGLNMLTVRMLLKAEQRTVTAVLHSRSPTQTREVLVAAYRRAGLNMQHAPTEEHDPPAMVGLDGMRSAMLAQTTITSHIADRLASMPSNHDFVSLLQSVQQHTQLQQTLIDQNTLMMNYLRALHERDQHGDELPTQEHQEPPQPREWDTSRRDQYPPTPTGSEAPEPEAAPSLPDPPAERPEEVMPILVDDDAMSPSGQPSNALDAMQEVSARQGDAQRPTGPATAPFRAGR